MTCITVGERYGEDSATSLQMLLQADAKLHNADSGFERPNVFLPVCYQPRCQRRSSQTLWAHRPLETGPY